MDGLDDELARCLDDLRAGKASARERILEVCDGRLRDLSSRLLGKFARVKRWDSTDDVAQGAAFRLFRALGETVPDSPRGLMGLMATVIQRELLDLAKKHAGPMSYAANHGTNVHDRNDGQAFIVDEAMDRAEQDEEIPLERWEAFHAAIESLPAELREVFQLVWYLGMEQKAVADTLGISPRTAARRWREAREDVARTLGDAGTSDSKRAEGPPGH